MMLLSRDTERIRYENKFLINFGKILFSYLTLPLRKGVHLEQGGDRLLSIGEFSKICKVSTKTLRYYDEIRLIHPEDINPENGYRRVFPQSPRISYTQPSSRRTTLRRLLLISIFHKTEFSGISSIYSHNKITTKPFFLPPAR